jgi:hypothetical protein
MPSQSKLEANRRNAQLSTGPKTPEGKAASARNSLKHGLLASETVLPDEDTEAFLDLLAALEAEHQPASPLEEFLVQQLANAQWRLRRLTRVETGLLASRLDDTRDRVASYEENDEDDDDASEPNPDDQDPQQAHDETTRLLGLSFHYDSSAAESFSKLSRYENTIRRAFYKALYALQFAQARRAGQPPPRMPI